MAQCTHIHVRRRNRQGGLVGRLRRHFTRGWLAFAAYADAIAHPAAAHVTTGD